MKYCDYCDGPNLVEAKFFYEAESHISGEYVFKFMCERHNRQRHHPRWGISEWKPIALEELECRKVIQE